MRLSLFIGAIMSCAMLSGCEPLETDTTERKDVKTLSVTGVGEVEVMPDQFVLSGAIIKQEDTAKAAMNALAEVVNAMQDSTKDKAGLDNQQFNFASVNTVGVKDPECLLFNQEADRTNNTLRDGEQRVKKRVCKDIAQQASISFTFTGGPPDMAGDVLADFSKAGGIRLALDGYKIENIDEIEMQAGERAIANAREKADRLAAAGGAKITGVVDLNSYQATYNQRRASAPSISTYGAGESTQLVDGGDPVDVASLNLKAGKQVISASVALEFIYE